MIFFVFVFCLAYRKKYGLRSKSQAELTEMALHERTHHGEDIPEHFHIVRMIEHVESGICTNK